MDEQQPKAFTIKYPALVSQLISSVRVCDVLDPAAPAAPLVETVNALWDTGSNISSISKRVVDKLGLATAGTIEMGHTGGISRIPYYFASLLLTNNVFIPCLTVTESPGHLQHVDAIIGMDIIGQGDFCVMNKNGQTWFSFQMFPVGAVDFRETQGESAGRSEIIVLNSGDGF